MSETPKVLDDIADKVLRYKPAPKSEVQLNRAKKASKVKRKKKRESNI